MGFRPEPRQYKLNFEGTELDGLTVIIGSATLGEFNRMMRPAATPEEAAADNEYTLGLFLDRLVEWDLEDQDGTPVPATKEGAESQDRSIVVRIIAAWQLAITRVAPPLPKESANGSSGSLTAEELTAMASSPGS